MAHTVEKIGGTSMNDYAAVRDNIVSRRTHPYGRIFVVSAYGGVTNLLLEHKKTAQPGVFASFANARDDDAWTGALTAVRERLAAINHKLFAAGADRAEADAFVTERLTEAEHCLADLDRLCRHGHFQLGSHLATVREMVASIGEAHSAWNLARLLARDGLRTRFVDLTGWSGDTVELSLDERIRAGLADVDVTRELPIVTGYAHCKDGLMARFDRGYSEMTFSRTAVLTGAAEAIIHKEYHLSSADPAVVGADRVVPIGRTNYDVADQLANLGMEAIHPRAAKGLRQSGIPLRIKNTFDPEHGGTVITHDYVSAKPCVEIIAGRRNVYALEMFDQDMMGRFAHYDQTLLAALARFGAGITSKDCNANTLTHYLSCNLKTVKRVQQVLTETLPEAEFKLRRVAMVSAIGSDMRVPGLLAETAAALAAEGISILAMHQSLRQVDMQCVVDERDYEIAIRALHRRLVERHDHGVAICAA